MKTKSSTRHQFKDMPKTYEQLCRIFLPRPIHDNVQFRNTCEIAETFAGHTLNNDQGDYFEILSELIEDYEAETSPEPKVKASAMLEFLMEQQEMNGSDLARLLKVDRSLVSRILNGKRQLTVPQIKVLSRKLSVSTSVFID
ncbi:MAG: helix-turn-helix domain-containing protein [Verrucomicrobiota bacterium]|nr:helix-turn-helix domain-containing protein [Verrucomicrobiota bacterium]